jgi:hypothetical protein
MWKRKPFHFLWWGQEGWHDNTADPSKYRGTMYFTISYPYMYVISVALFFVLKLLIFM